MCNNNKINRGKKDRCEKINSRESEVQQILGRHFMQPHLPMSSRLLPPGWEKVVDPSSGRNYFQHAASHTSSWTVPTHEPASLSLSSTSIADPHAHDDGVLLQSGWSRVVCPTSGKGYYQNLSTRESSWDVPKAPLAAEAPPAAHTATPSTQRRLLLQLKKL